MLEKYLFRQSELKAEEMGMVESVLSGKVLGWPDNEYAATNCLMVEDRDFCN